MINSDYTNGLFTKTIWLVNLVFGFIISGSRGMCRMGGHLLPVVSVKLFLPILIPALVTISLPEVIFSIIRVASSFKHDKMDLVSLASTFGIVQDSGPHMLTCLNGAGLIPFCCYD